MRQPSSSGQGAVLTANEQRCTVPLRLLARVIHSEFDYFYRVVTELPLEGIVKQRDAGHSGIDEPLGTVIDGAIASPSIWLTFPPALEAKYEADRLQIRRREIVWLGVAGAVLYALFALLDEGLVPDVFAEAVKLRLCFVTLVLVSIPFATHEQTPRWLRESCVSAFAVGSMAVVMYIFSITLAPYKPAYPAGVVLILFYGGLCLQPPLRYAAGACFLCLAIFIYALIGSAIPLAVAYSQMAVLLVSAGFIMATVYRLERQQRKAYLLGLRAILNSNELAEHNAKLLALSQCDALTGLNNRRSVDDHLQDAWLQCGQRGEPLGVVMIDVDNFKIFNDRYGHLAGDQCLRDVASAIREVVPEEQGLVGRFGGEEFIVILPGVALTECVSLAECLRLIVQDLAMVHMSSTEEPTITISLGVACVEPTSNRSISALLSAADAALYASKAAGRNVVSVARCPRR